MWANVCSWLGCWPPHCHAQRQSARACTSGPAGPWAVHQSWFSGRPCVRWTHLSSSGSMQYAVDCKALSLKLAAGKERNLYAPRDRWLSRELAYGGTQDRDIKAICLCGCCATSLVQRSVSRERRDGCGTKCNRSRRHDSCSLRRSLQARCYHAVCYVYPVPSICACEATLSLVVATD